MVIDKNVDAPRITSQLSEMSDSVIDRFGINLDEYERTRKLLQVDVTGKLLSILSDTADFIYGDKSSSRLSISTELVMRIAEQFRAWKGDEVIKDANPEFGRRRFARRVVDFGRIYPVEIYSRLVARDIRIGEIALFLQRHTDKPEDLLEEIYEDSEGISYKDVSELQTPERPTDRRIATDHGSYDVDLYNKDIDEILSKMPNEVANAALAVVIELLFRQRIETGRTVAELVDFDWPPEMNAEIKDILVKSFGRNIFQNLQFRQSSPPQVFEKKINVCLGAYDRSTLVDINLFENDDEMNTFYRWERETSEEKKQITAAVFKRIYAALVRGVNLSQQPLSSPAKDKVSYLSLEAIQQAYTYDETIEKQSKDEKADLVYVFPTRDDDPNELAPNMINKRMKNKVTDRCMSIKRGTSERYLDDGTSVVDKQRFLIHQYHPAVDGKLLTEQMQSLVEREKELFLAITDDVFGSESVAELPEYKSSENILFPKGPYERELAIQKVKQLAQARPDIQRGFSFLKSWTSEQNRKFVEINQKLTTYFKTIGLTHESLRDAKYVVNLDSLTVEAVNFIEHIDFGMQPGKTDVVGLSYDQRINPCMIAAFSPEHQRSMFTYYSRILNDGGEMSPDARRGKMLVDVLALHARERALPVSISVVLSWLTQTVGGQSAEIVLSFISKNISDPKRASLVVSGSGGLFSKLGKLQGFTTARLEYNGDHLCTAAYENEDGQKALSIRASRKQRDVLAKLCDENGKRFKLLLNAMIADVDAFVKLEKPEQVEGIHEGKGIFARIASWRKS